MNNTNDPQVLSWRRQDIEQRLCFRGGRFTKVNNLFCGLCGFAGVVLLYLVLSLIPRSQVTAMFTERGLTPYFICFLAMWSSVILIVKRLKLGMQQKTIAIAILPETEDFTLSVSTVDQLFERIGMVVDSPSHFVLFRRIHIALSNLRNLGRVTDVDAMLKSQAEHDESTMETSYSIIRGFVWAIPVLGFIGTVIGLSQAIGGFGEVVGNGGDINDITSSLSVVTAGLSTAFETTLLALVFALIIQLAMTFLKKSEEEFLDDCEEYCQKHIVNRLRIMPFEQEVHESA